MGSDGERHKKHKRLAHYFGCRGSYTVDDAQSEITMSPNGSVSILGREMIFESFFAEIRAYIW